MTLDALSPRERDVIALRCDYYSGKEIARKLGMSHGAVSAHTFRARQKYNAITLGEMCRRVRLQMGAP